ncbi:hypothetical protein E2320_013969 [Naja naja]|nr:hypothetical protein E2320_013969 [Naja naja]
MCNEVASHSQDILGTGVLRGLRVYVASPQVAFRADGEERGGGPAVEARRHVDPAERRAPLQSQGAQAQLVTARRAAVLEGQPVQHRAQLLFATAARVAQVPDADGLGTQQVALPALRIRPAQENPGRHVERGAAGELRAGLRAAGHPERVVRFEGAPAGRRAAGHLAPLGGPASLQLHFLAPLFHVAWPGGQRAELGRGVGGGVEGGEPIGEGGRGAAGTVLLAGGPAPPVEKLVGGFRLGGDDGLFSSPAHAVFRSLGHGGEKDVKGPERWPIAPGFPLAVALQKRTGSEAHTGLLVPRTTRRGSRDLEKWRRREDGRKKETAPQPFIPIKFSYASSQKI